MKWVILPQPRYAVQLKGPIQYSKEEFLSFGHFPCNVGNVLWWLWKCNIIIIQEGRWNSIYMSNSSVLLSLEFSLLVLGMTLPDIFLLAFRMGRLVELVDLLTGLIKPTEDSLPKKYQIRQPQWFPAPGVTNPAGCFSSSFSALDVQTLSFLLVMNEKWQVFHLMGQFFVWHISYSVVYILCQDKPVPASSLLIYFLLIHLLSALHSGSGPSLNTSLL